MYDLAIVIPTYNVAHTINYVVYQAALGLEKYFPEKKSVIFVSDGGSTDGTVEVVKAFKKTIGSNIIVERYKGVSGKGSAILHAFQRVKEMGVKALAMVDSDLRSIQPSWIYALIQPIIDGYDFVTPLYTRHKYDGTITNQLAYPLTKTLYSVNLRQPIGGDFGLSIKLVENLLENSFNNFINVRKFGIDVFITNTALALGYKVAQADLGTKVHEAKDPSELESMFQNVSATQLLIARKHRDRWRIEKDLEPVLYKAINVWRFVQPLEVDIESNVSKLKNVFKERKSLIDKYLPCKIREEVYSSIESVTVKKKPVLSPEIWAKCVYYHLAAINEQNHDSVTSSLHVLWLARVLSFILGTLDLDNEEAEKQIRKDAEAFKAAFSEMLQ
ncbi:MAG: glycosyltransferase [Thermofilum sp. ex4484_82]|nr:MAG: glycosyltransferase [Thermofilum sp. ex4484_82]OYT39105.1 MAG: glycosyltransferase [Archaeoglobales archaeon ex4484_92]